MNPEVKQKWIDALRSNEYQQGRDQLIRTADNRSYYCCLGVLCDVAVKEGIVPSWDADVSVSFVEDGIAEDDDRARAMRLLTLTPMEVQTWAGLGGVDPVVLHPDTNEEASLSRLNDSGVSFEVIAQIIEVEL